VALETPKDPFDLGGAGPPRRMHLGVFVQRVIYHVVK